MGLLAQIIRDKVPVTLVGINQCKSTYFNIPPFHKVIGVNGLAVCSIFAIVSPLAAIVAHIGPNILHAPDDKSFVRLAENLVNEVVSQVQNNPQFFPTSSKTLVLCSLDDNIIKTAPEQLQAMYDGFEKLKHTNIQWFYQLKTIRDRSVDGPQGTFVMDARSGAPRLYVEDKDITDEQTEQPIWQYVSIKGQMRYGFILRDTVIKDQANPPLHQQIWKGSKWVVWDGTNWK